MPRSITLDLPGRDLRLKSDKSEEEIASMLSTLLKEPFSVRKLELMEYRGTRLYRYIKALSVVYGVPEEVAAAAFEKDFSK